MAAKIRNFHRFFVNLYPKIPGKFITMRLKRFSRNIYAVTAMQFLAAVIVMELLRGVFMLYNSDLMCGCSFKWVCYLFVCGLRFDLCATAWFLLPFMVMRILPFSFITRRGYVRASGVMYGIGATLLMLLQVGDTFYFPFSGSRLNWQSLKMLVEDPSMIGVLFSYVGQYWWAFLFGLVLIGLMWCIALLPGGDRRSVPVADIGRRRAARVGMFVLMGGAVLLCIRGKLGGGKPVDLTDAYVVMPDLRHYNVVINTPFSVLRSIGDNGELPVYDFFADDEIEAMRPPVHMASLPDSLNLRGKNIVFIVLESGTSLWLDNLAVKKGESAACHQPFLNDLAAKSLAVRHAMGSGKRSIEGITGIFGGFPTYSPMYYLASPYSNNDIDAHVSLLRDHMGYATKFYYGGHHGAFNIDIILRVMGFSEVTNRENLSAVVNEGNKWGIYDHVMARYIVSDISRLPEPFYAGWFTLSPHPPFDVPADFNSSASDAHLREVEYADHALKLFFEEAAKQPWFDNTVFILTGDHGSRDMGEGVYSTPYICNHIIFMIYTPDGSIAPGVIEDRVLTHFDMGPTVLDLAGYDREYFSLGRSLFDPAAGDGFVLTSADGYFLACDPEFAVALSGDFKQVGDAFMVTADPTLESPLPRPYPARVDSLVDKARAFMQDYSARMRGNRMTLVRR